MANLSVWARAIAQAVQYQADAAMHQVQTVPGKECLRLAAAALARAERVAASWEENTITSHMAASLNALQPKETGGNEDGPR